MQIKLSDHFTYGRLLRFTFPSIAMMIFTSIYGVVDGFFVSNFAGKTPFAAVNLIMPLLMIVATVGFLFGTGGTAIVSNVLGQGDRERANRYFSLFTYLSLGLGIFFSLLGFVLIRPISRMLGAQGALLENCVVYGRIILLATLFYILQLQFQSVIRTAASPKMSLAGTVFNLQLIHYDGENGVAAYGVMMYLSMIFSGAFIGYSIGTDPVIGFHYGAQNHAELKSLLRKSLVLLSILGICMTAAAELMAQPLAQFFVGYDPALMQLTVSGFRIFALCFLFMLGGLAAGLGSALYDILFYPAYIDECWITFLTKGAYALVAGWIAWRGKPCAYWKATLATAAGAVTYAALYLLKSYFYKGLLIQGLTHQAAMIAVVSKLPATIFNAVVAIVFAPILAVALQKALERSHLSIQ